MADPLIQPAAPLVSVLIVNYNSGRHLAACLAALADQQFQDFETIVVDNGSVDDSLANLGQCPAALQIDKAAENLGFAAGNNRAAALAKGSWLALLNPDTVPDANWLGNLVAASRRHPNVDIFAALQWQPGQEDVLDGAGDPYHVLGAAWRGGKGRRPKVWPMEGEVFSACGAAMMIRADVFNALDGFEERYFCYYEDVDLGFRARLQGRVTVLVPSAQVTHVGSASGASASAFAVYHITRNRLFTLLRNMPLALLLPVLVAVLMIEILGLLKAIGRRQVRPRGRALWAVLTALPWLLRSRRGCQTGRQISIRSLAAQLTWSPFKLIRRGIDIRAISPPFEATQGQKLLLPTATVGAVIVSYNPGPEIADAVARLQRQVDHLWIIDNGSQAADLAALRVLAAQHKAWLTLIENPHNLGLGAAQNQGLMAVTQAAMDWLLLLDDDSVPAANMVAALRAAAAREADPSRLGLLVPRLIDPAGSVNAPVYLKGPLGWVWRRRLRPGQTVRGLSFAAASGSLMPVSVLSRVGLMRAEFFIDYIDIDFCLRLQRAGLTMVAVGDACLQHRFGVPAEGDGRRWRRAHSSARLRTIFQNRLQVWRDYGGLYPGYVLFDGLAVIRDLLRIIVSDPERSEKLRAIWDGIGAAIRRP